MKKMFSLQIIKQSFKSVWIWLLVAVLGQSANFLLFPANVETAEDKLGLASKFIEEGLVFNGIVFLIIISLICATVLITSEVEKGSLSITLNTPTTRKQILLSKLLVFVIVIGGICLSIGVIGTLSPLMWGYGAEFDFAKWWIAIALWFMYSFLCGGIAFFFGCWFNKSRFSLAVTAIILGAFFMISMIAQMSSFEFMKYFTLQTLFDVKAVIQGNSVAWQMIVMPIIAITLYVLGTIKFLKKDLPL